MSEMKICSKCNKDYPATTEFFSRYKGGLQRWCKSCQKAYSDEYKKQYYLDNKKRISQARKEKYRLNNPKEEIPEGFKKCSSCKELKPSTNEFFSKAKKNKDGFSHRCKLCRRQAEYWNDPDKVQAKRKEYYENNKEKVLEMTKKYKKENLEWYQEYNKKYYKENEEKIKTNAKASFYRRIESDIGFRILQRCRKRLWDALKGHVKSKRTIELIGCSVETLLEHLESQFQEGMTWDNYGKWHVDHIKPCALFDFSKEEHQKECFHYTNLQPLWAVDNIRKSDKYDKAL